MADRQVLAAVVGNLLQNAFKFTRPHTTVTLRVVASAERVLIEIQDECGGLPAGMSTSCSARSSSEADRTGVGLGLAFSRWGVEANNGRIYARNLPDKGCVLPSTCRGSPFVRLRSSSRDARATLVDRREAASGSKCFQVLEGRELVRGVPEIATFAFGESGTPCHGVLNVPAVAAVDEGHLIVRHGRNDQKVMAILDLRHDNVIQL